MIKKMERRFTIVAISVISLVLLFLVLAVQLVSNQVNIRKADLILTTIASESSEMIFGNMGTIDMKSLRSFSVTVALEGDEASYEISSNDYVEEDIAMTMALDVIEKGKPNGFIDEFRYLIIEEDNRASIYFLDYSFEQASAMSFMWVSLVVYGISVLLVGLLVKVFMKFVMRPIKESYEKQKQFITDASHELKTPLTVISTDMQLIEMESGPTKWVKSVNKQVQRLTTLSNELVLLSTMDETSNELVFEGFNISDLVSDVVYGFEPAIVAGGRFLETAIEDGIKMEGNYDALEKVMSILMENALKYGSANGEVKVKLWRKGKGLGLSVENTVDAIDEGDHSAYFERFYRADQSRNSKTGGFGIGLAVAKSVVEQHHGKIVSYSPDNHRIVFRIDL